MRPPPLIRSPDRVPLTAMIDVVFLLLIFFVWTSRMDPPEIPVAARTSLPQPPQSQPTSVPEAGSSRRLAPWIVQIVRGAAGSIRYRTGGRPDVAMSDVTMPEILATASQIAALPLQPPIIIEPAPDIAMQAVMDLHESLRGRGLRSVSLAAPQGEMFSTGRSP